MMCSILCCVSAALVERKRLNIVMLNQMKMSMYCLVFQFVLLGGIESFLDKSVSAYYKTISRPYQCKNTSKPVWDTCAVEFVVGKIIERGGKSNWIQHS